MLCWGTSRWVCFRCLLVGLLVSELPSCVSTSDSTLAFVFGISRHGHRSPVISIYPQEQYQEKVGKYFPEGLGQLTKVGKQAMYKVGEALQNRYAQFLGQEYYDEKVRFTATDSTRAIMSSMLVSAGMFPPRGSQVWKEDLKWQPIPVFTDTNHFDKHHIFHKMAACPRINQKVMERRIKLITPDISPENRQLFEFLSNNTGQNVTSVTHVSGIHDFLECQKSAGIALPEWAEEVHPNKTRPFTMKFHQELSDDEEMQKVFAGKKYLGNVSQKSAGIALPEWAEEVHPNKTRPFTMKFHQELSDDEEMQKVFAGPVLHEIKTKLQEKANSQLIPNRLMYFHASHDMVLRPLLVGLGFNATKYIHPGDTILFELHLINDSFKVKIFYLKPKESLEQFIEMPVPGCASPCELSTFIKIIPSIAPETWQSYC